MLFFNESTEDDIPNSIGLYAFYLDMLAPAKIGLGGPGPFSELTLHSARQRLASRITRQLSLTNDMRLMGEICEPKPGSHLRKAFHVEAKYVQGETAQAEALGVNLRELREYATVLSKCMSLERPIYVGITSGQSFKQRYLQHKTDFYSNPTSEGTFGGRFAVAGGEWDDLTFACIEVSSDLFSGASLGRLERLVHSLTQPKYSLR